MNYLVEINAFYQWLPTETISAHAVTLWGALMQTANRKFWAATFEVPIATLQAFTKLSRDSIYKARDELKAHGRITYTSRGGSASAVYSIIPFSIKTVSNFVSPTTTQSTTQPAAPSRARMVPRDLSNNNNNIYNNTVVDIEGVGVNQKPRAREAPPPKNQQPPEPKIEPPTLEEVTAYCEERGYISDPEHCYKHYAQFDWTTKDGRPLKNWRDTVDCWERREIKFKSQRLADRRAGEDTPRALRYDQRPFIDDEYDFDDLGRLLGEPPPHKPTVWGDQQRVAVTPEGKTFIAIGRPIVCDISPEPLAESPPPDIKAG